MKDSILLKPLKEKTENLTLRFGVAAILAVVISVFLMTCAAYYYLRTTALEAQMASKGSELAMDVLSHIDFTDFNEPDIVTSAQWNAIRKRHAYMDMAYFAPDSRVIWASREGLELKASEIGVFKNLLTAAVPVPVVVDTVFSGMAGVAAIIDNRFQPMVSFTPIVDQQQQLVGVVKGSHSFDLILLRAGTTTLKLFVVFLIGHILLVFVLYINFRRGIQTIEKQETRLSEQITRLSNLLALNKSMQKNMKSASSRAVELNEQFLRRVGADLHDGPAQSIGYSVLRLNQVSKMEESKALGHEFHAVREALDSALTEIRGISSGLVLPELDEMTLEECLNRVVSRHKSNSDIKVSQFYQNMPKHLTLPIKICAYRFVQEGLNNASRHGQAEKCRVSAHVKDDVLHLSLKDNGMGFRKSQLSTEGGHLGLMGLKDRIESLGGKFSINSELGVGTAIKVSIGLTDDL